MTIRLECPAGSATLALNILARIGLASRPSSTVVVAHGRDLREDEIGVAVPRGVLAALPAAGPCLVSEGDNRWRARFDLFAVTDALLRGDFDTHSMAAAETIPAVLREAPVLDGWWREVGEALESGARRVGLPIERVHPWPTGKRHVVFLSHDVDSLDGRSLMVVRKAAWVVQALRARVRGDAEAEQLWRARYRRWTSLPPGEDPQFNVPTVANDEEARGFRSTFYFFGRRRALSRDTGRAYCVQNELLRSVVRDLESRGFECGVHGAYPDSTDASGFFRERANLAEVTQEPPRGIRQHNLNLALRATWRAQLTAGYAYDASLGWNCALGFRAGTALPVVPTDVGASADRPFLVLPLVVQDGPLLRERATPTPSWMLERVAPLRRRTAEVQGIFSLLAHPISWDEVDAPTFRTFYNALLDEIASDSSVWVTTGLGIAEAWWDYLRRLAGGDAPRG